MQIRVASSLGGRLAWAGATLARALEVLAWAAFFAFALTLLGLRYWLLPNVERYREDLTAAISRSIGLPVRIGAIETDWLGLRPRLTIADVRVYDRDGREALVLPLVENVLSWRSAAMLQLRLRSFVIEGPKLTVRRDRSGEIFVAGIRVSGEKGDGQLADWILDQNEIVVRDAEIEWRDELRGAPPLVLSALNFRLRNDYDLHQIGLSARPPRHLGPGVELRAELYGHSVTQLAEWNGRVYAELGYTDIAGWRAWFDYPLDLRSGEGALRVWASLQRGQLKRATVDLALADVAAQLGSGLPLLEIASVRGRLQGRASASGYEFGVRNLALATAHAPPMSATSFRALWEPAAGARPQRGSVSADLIELAPLARLAEYVPFPADLRKLLADAAPQGNLLDTRFEWSGELQAGASFKARTRFAGLAINAWRNVPGFSGLSGVLEASESKGTVYVAARDASLDLPRIFPEPRVHFDTLNGELAWERRAEGALSLQLANLVYANQDLAGTAFGSYTVRAGDASDAIDLSAHIARANGARTARYLPLSPIMGEETRRWLARSILGGRVADARLRLKGELRDFPFADPAKGQFQVAAKVRGGVLDYASGWPRIEAIDGDLLFERDKMEVVGRGGVIHGARIANVRASIPSLLAQHTRLVIDGQAEGPSADFLGFIQASPVRRMIDGFTDQIGALGRGKLRLRLELPLNDLSKSRVAGEVQLAANTVTVDARLPPIVAATGRVSFTESSLSLHEVRGQLFGDAVTLSGGVTPETGVAIVARGRATVEGLRAVFDHPWRSRLSGAANYTANLTIKDGRTQLRFESPLQGVGSTLPPPLAKNPGDTLPLRVDVYPGEGRQRVSAALDQLVAAEFLQTQQGGVLRLQRAALALNPAPGEAPRIPERRGFAIRGTIPALDLDRWLPYFAEGGSADDPVSFDLKIGVLDAIGKRMREADLAGVAEAGGWSAKMSTREFAGDLVYRGEGGGTLVGRFARFTLPEDHPGAKAFQTAKQLPAVDLVAESFVHRGRRLGRVEIAAQHEGKDWRIEKLALTSPDATLSGRGLWRTGDNSRTSLAFKLEVNDVGKFLDRFGYPDHVKGANGRLEGALEWNGDPVLVDYATLSGALKLQAGDGQFLEIEPGIGKLVALMSLQMLPRRIALDFRDVFSKGFQFDRISSSLGVTRGVMQVKDFQMRGPAAEVLMNGQIDLSLETQNLQVKVVPSLGDTASTVAGVIGGPVAGVATMIAQRVLKNPLGHIFSYDYAITGTWGDPKVEKVQLSPPRASESAPGN